MLLSANSTLVSSEGVSSVTEKENISQEVDVVRPMICTSCWLEVMLEEAG